MASYDSVEDAVLKQKVYPALDRDLADHDFQRRRVSSCVRFMRDGDKVLEVACNTGYIANFCPPNLEIHGVDVNPDLVKIAASRLVSARVARAEDLPFDDRSFDLVNVSGLLEQCFDPLLILQEAARVSRRSVTGTTTHANGTWGKHRIPYHSWQSFSFSEDEIRSLLNSVGKITFLGTIDGGSPPGPECWFWEVVV